MTVVAAIVRPKSVVMASDSIGACTPLLSKIKRRDPKVFTNGEYLIGYTSSFRMGQLLKNMELPDPKGEISKFMETSFVEAVRREFRSKAFSAVKDSVEQGGSFLVAVRGRLFEIESDFQVGEAFYSYNAVGCGKDYALGSFFSTEDSKLSDEKRVVKAVQAAIEFSMGCGGNINIVSRTW